MILNYDMKLSRKEKLQVISLLNIDMIKDNLESEKKKFVNRYEGYYYRSHNDVLFVIKVALKWADIPSFYTLAQSLTNHEKIELYNLLFVHISKAAKKVRNKQSNMSYSTVRARKLNRKYRKVSSSILTLQTRLSLQKQVAAKQLAIVSANKLTPVAIESATTPTLWANCTLEEYSDLSAKLVTLKNLWEETRKLTLTVEDEYFLEQTAETYVPDACKLFKNVVASEAGLTDSAVAMMESQLNLLTEKLTEIKSNAANNALDGLKVQTVFIESLTPKKMLSK